MASCARLGLMYRDGRGTILDRQKAWEYLSIACAGGDASGCAELGRLHIEDDGLRRDAFQAAMLVNAACESGEGHGCDYLARLCTNRIGYPQDAAACSSEVVNGLRQRAVTLLRKDCEGWGAYDCNTLAGIYSTGDTATALRFASGACAGGDPGGCYELGRLYETDASTLRSDDLYRRACDAGFSSACRRYAIGRIAAGR